MSKVILLGFLALFTLACFAEESITKDELDYKKRAARAAIEYGKSSECEKAGGELIKISECDMTESLWCVISKKEQCYADQVSEGKCTEGKYSEELQAIVGISPRVICNEDKWSGYQSPFRLFPDK